MNYSVLLTITSLLSIVLMTLHLSDDMVRGFSEPGLDNLIGIAIMVVWLYGSLLLAGRRSGYVIMLFGAVFAAAMPVLHVRGASFPDTVRSPGGIFFFWTVFTVGSVGAFSLVLAARCLWNPRWAVTRLFNRPNE